MVHSGVKSILGVTLRNNVSEVFITFEFVKPVSVIAGKNLHGEVAITSGKNINCNPHSDLVVLTQNSLFIRPHKIFRT